MALQRLVISDIDIPFWRLVVIFIKWAAIPAAIILSLIMMLVAGVFMLLGMGWMMRPL